MRKKPPSPRWHSEVKALRANGIDPKVIAAQFRKGVSLIRWVLDENGERQAALDRAREQRVVRRHLGTQRETNKPSERRSKSSVSAVPRETINEAVRDFAARRIDRATLMARITPLRGEHE